MPKCSHNYITVHSFNGPFSKVNWVSWHQNGRTILNFNESGNDGVAVASAGPYADHLKLALDNHTSTSQNI